MSTTQQEDIDISESKVATNINTNALLKNSYDSSLTNQALLKTISNLSSELLIHIKKQETLSLQIKNNKSLYNQQLKQYKSLTESIIQLENNIDTIHLKLSSIKKHQQLILSNITDDNFQYLLSIIPHIKPDIYEGFLLFINYSDYKREQITYILQNKMNLINLLENSFWYIEQKHALLKNEYIIIKHQIETILDNNINNNDFIFGLLYDYMKRSFDLIDLTEESNNMQKKIDDLNNEKNKRFIELKLLENEILKKDVNLQSIVKYVNNINTVIEKTKNDNNHNKDILNHKLLNGYNENKVNEQEQSKTNDEKITNNTKSNSPRNKNHLKRNHTNNHSINFYQSGHNKQSSYSSVGSNININVFNSNNSKKFSATAKIKPISSLSIKTFKVNANNNNNNAYQTKKSDKNKKFPQNILAPSVIAYPSSQKSAKKHTVLSSKSNGNNRYSCISESNIANLVKVNNSNSTKQKSFNSQKGNSISSTTMINLKANFLDTKEQFKISSNPSPFNSQLLYMNNKNNHNNASKENLLINTNNKKHNENTNIKTKTPLKLNSTKITKTRNNNLLYTKKLNSSKQQQPNKIKQLITFHQNGSSNKSSNIHIEQEPKINSPNNNPSNNLLEKKALLTDIHNLTYQSDNYQINNSKDSFNISDINSVCDELTVSPLSLLPSTLSNNLAISHNTSSVFQGVNHNLGAYIQNSYILMQRNKDGNYKRKGGIVNKKGNFMNFKIEKPIPAGGCCVSCT